MLQSSAIDFHFISLRKNNDSLFIERMCVCVCVCLFCVCVIVCGLVLFCFGTEER